jgi:site-specific recombinase XerD
MTWSRCAPLLGHTRVDTAQIYATIRPARLKRAVSFHEGESFTDAWRLKTVF